VLEGFRPAPSARNSTAMLTAQHPAACRPPASQRSCSPAISVITKVPQRIQFRLCVLTYRCLHGTAPTYLSKSLHSVNDIYACRHLRSADTSTLLVPPTRRSTVGDRMFPVAAARTWNALPVTVRSTSSPSTLSAFCRHSAA